MDPDSTSSLYQILSIGALVILNGLFVASEYALISYDPAPLRNAGGGGSNGKDPEKELEKKSRAILWLLNNSELCVASIQFGITACSLLIGYLGIQFLYTVLSGVPLVSPVENSWLNEVALEKGGLYFGWILSLVPFVLKFLGSVILLTLIHVIFGELLVKAIGTAFPEATLRVLAGPMKLFTQVTYPISLVAYRFANIFLNPFQLSVAHNDNAVLSLAELKRLFSSVPSTSEIKVEQAAMIRGVVGFSETIAREVMTPRTDLVTIKADSNFDQVIESILESGFSRYLVRGERVDDVVGILLARDVLPFLAGAAGESRTSFNLKKVMRKPYFIPGTKAIDELLNEFKRRNQHIAVVLDEHGGVDGVVTLEDLIEEIVGNIYDEGDEPEREFVREPGGDLIVDGGVLVADLNEKFGLDIPEGEYDTVAGFIFTFLGRIPRNSDRIFISTDEKSVYVNDKLERSNYASGSNGSSNSVFRDEEDRLVGDRPGIKVSVERVRGHRIESVRFSFIVVGEKLEVPGQLEGQLAGESAPAAQSMEPPTVSSEAESLTSASQLKSVVAR